MSSRKIRYRKSDGTVVTEKFTFNKSKKYKFNKTTGAVEEFTGTPAADEITIPGSKSSLRRLAEVERNISILASKSGVSGSTNSDTDTILKTGGNMTGALQMNGTTVINTNLDMTTRVLTVTNEIRVPPNSGTTDVTITCSGDEDTGFNFDGNGGVTYVSNGSNKFNLANVYHTGYHPSADLADLATNSNALGGVAPSKYSVTTAESSGTAGAGWVTVAHSAGGRTHSEVIVTDSESGDHAYVRIDWMRSYADSVFTVINCGGHANRITGVRVLYDTSDNTYSSKYLQVYVTTSSLYRVKVTRPGAVQSGWGTHAAITPVVENTKTGYAVHGNSMESLDTYAFAAEEGIRAGGSILAGGDITAYSDITLKENVNPIADALSKVESLTGITFTRKSDGSKATGVIAQEVEKVLPEAVHTDGTGVKAVAYGNLVGMLVESIKELSGKVAELESKLSNK